MDAIDILGGLLGRRSGRSGSGRGPDILRDIFSRGSRPAPTPRSGRGGDSADPADLKRQAEELEEMLNVARDRNSTRSAGQPQSPPSAPERTPSSGGYATETPASPRRESGFPSPSQAPAPRQNDDALVLVRAMVNAAKADGQVTPAEQQAILEQMGGAAPDAIPFLRQEFSQPLNVREFAWSVPPGMEQKVYAMSLIAIDGESEAVSRYLQDLAHGLRLSPETCAQLRRRYGRT